MLSKFTGTAILAISSILSLALGAKAAEMKVAGTMSASVVQQQVIPLGSTITLLSRCSTRA